MTGDHDHSGEQGHVDHWVLLPSPEITATVQTALVPEIAPAALRDVLVPRYGPDGRLDDWLLDAGALVDDDGPGHGGFATYWAWRQQWCRTWPMGSQANITALLQLAADLGLRLDPTVADLLERLTYLDPAEDGGEDVYSVLQPSVVDALLRGLDDLRSDLVASRADGIGIVDDTPGQEDRTGLARAWAPVTAELMLAADRSTALVVRPEFELVLMHGGPHYTAFHDVVAVDLSTDPVVVTARDGSSCTLPPSEARPLSWLVPNSLRWHLRSVPLVTVWAGLLAGLPEAVLLAQRIGSSVVFSVGTSIHSV